jgi:Putative metallopeptidase
MTNQQDGRGHEATNQRHVVRRGARASRLVARVAVLVAFVVSCVPYQPGQYQQGGFQQSAYQQGSYQQGQYQQGPYQQGQYQQGQYGSGEPSYAMRVTYEPAKKPELEKIRGFLQENQMFDHYSLGLNKMFKFPQDVSVVFTECGLVNAAWDGQSKIVMCYEMAAFLKGLFGKKIKDPKQLTIAVMSSLTFVFLHELGHGLISVYKLPAVGREEDAADQLAGLVLITTGDSGLEVAMHGAQFFRTLALSGVKTPFFDEHSLDAQRYYNVLCMLYGSNPQRLGTLVGNDKLPASRAKRCPREYGKINAAWGRLLDPHMRRNQYSGQPSGNQNRQRPMNRGNAGNAGGYSDGSGYSDDSRGGY